MRLMFFALAAGAAALAACTSIQPARMVLPAGLSSSTEEVAIIGIGGGTKGTFQVAGHTGSFKRSESRLVIFDVLDSRSGGASFTLTGPMISDSIEADCRVREKNITLGVISFTPKKMSYQCDFTANGYPFPARFEVQEAREGLSGMLNKAERRGEIGLDRVVLSIQSVHAVEGSSINMATPTGYVFSLDGQPTGAVELNGTPRVFLPIDDIAERRAVIAASLALALLWDPANSSL